MEKNVLAPSETFQKLTQLVKANKELSNIVKEMYKLFKSDDIVYFRLSNLYTIFIRNLRQIESNITTYQCLEQEINQLKENFEKKFEKEKRNFGTKLEESLNSVGLRLVGTFPEFKIGLFTIEVDFTKGSFRIWYGPKQEFLNKRSLSIESILKEIQSQKSKLASKIPLEKLYEKLRQAYVSVSKNQKKEGVRIIDILKELSSLLQDKKFYMDPKKENYFSYGRVNFSYDLYRLNTYKKNDLFQYKIKLISTTKATTKDRSNFLWVPENENGDGATYAFLKIEEV
ncbi:MAG: hypothetical protein N2517_05380 [Ignavibacteria bacterium]|nr:hypothetical protein [Ignavibacteria bacterium]